MITMSYASSNASTINNHTDYKLSFLVDVIPFLGIEPNTNITIVELRRTIQGSFIEATVVTNPVGYTIHISGELTQQEAKAIIIHELCHIAQYQDGRLKGVIGKLNKAIWKGESILTEDKRRDELPHEVDAILKTTETLNYLRELRKKRKGK